MVSKKTMEGIFTAFYLIVVLIISSRFVPKMKKAKINLFCRAWIVLSALSIANGYEIIMMHVLPKISQYAPAILNPKDIQLIFSGTIELAAIMSFPSLIFWHSGTPFIESKETIKEPEPRSEPTSDALAEQRVIWQRACFACVIYNVLIILISFIILET